jgi:Fe-S-cluster containining protein
VAKALEGGWFAGGLRFKCTSCGKCCTGTGASGSVQLSQADLQRLAGFFKLPVGRFVRQYTRSIKGRRVLNDRPDSHDCVFLAGKTCTVYEARPTQCRTYPWWAANLQDRESWQAAAAFCEGIDHPDAVLVAEAEILEQRRIS